MGPLALPPVAPRAGGVRMPRAHASSRLRFTSYNSRPLPQDLPPAAIVPIHSRPTACDSVARSLSESRHQDVQARRRARQGS
jgi:hypothetical protein